MKKKLFLTVVMAFVFILALAFAVSAETIHNSTNVDYDATVTLDDGTVLPLYDENNEALIWYISGTNGEGKNVYSSIRTDDSQVLWNTKSWGEVTSVSILLANGTKYEKKTFVVVNMMDDDVVSNSPEGGHTNIGKPITSFKWLFDGCKNLEYTYLRLDSDGIYQTGFQGCSKLKYINLEDLTNLKRLGNNGVFNGCTSLFNGQILDLSKTKLEKIDDGSEIFKDVPMKGIILPETFWRFTASNTFKNCTTLETVVLGDNISQVGSYIFNGCTSLKAIFFVGTEEKLDAFIAKAETAGNNGEITGATKISYSAYKALSNDEKSSKTYIVYDYSWCNAYNKSVHENVTSANACVGICDLCGDTIVNHSEENNLTVTITYKNYGIDGEKVTVCNNEGCGCKETKVAPALISCRGYSAPENGRGGIAIGFDVNNEAIKEYETVMNTTLEYGAFAVAKTKLGNNDIFDTDGAVADGVVNAEITSYEFASFELKIVGFTDEYKDTKLALGAYVITTSGEKSEYSYIQSGSPNENEKYAFTSFNEVVNS